MKCRLHGNQPTSACATCVVSMQEPEIATLRARVKELEMHLSACEMEVYSGQDALLDQLARNKTALEGVARLQGLLAEFMQHFNTGVYVRKEFEADVEDLARRVREEVAR